MTAIVSANDSIDLRILTGGRSANASSVLLNAVSIGTVGKSITANTGHAPIDTITLSAAAVSASLTATPRATASQTNQYAQFFPTRPGTNGAALGGAVADPGAQTISAGLSPDGIAAASRKSMDAEYAAMSASGKPYNPNSAGGVDDDTLMSGLDRTALSAVANNQDGLFTKHEQDQAQSLMSQQEGLAMGYPEGGVAKAANLPDPYAGDEAARSKADVQWLDKASPYEQSSIMWAMSRASAQVSYEWTMEGKGKTPEDLTSKNPLARTLVSAMQTMNLPGRKGNNPNAATEAQLLAEPWMKGFGGALATALAETKKMYGQVTQLASS